MYLRFISPLRLGGRRRRLELHKGIFQAAWTCRDELDIPIWLRKQIIEEMNWFNENLDAPYGYSFYPTYVRRFHPIAICWFKASAKSYIHHAWTLKALIEEAGLPMSVRHTQTPGCITYQDKYQIVAHPLRSDLPRFG